MVLNLFSSSLATLIPLYCLRWSKCHRLLFSHWFWSPVCLYVY